MAPAKTTKVADKQKYCHQIIAYLKRRYKVTVPKVDRPALETILYAICLENTTTEQANRNYELLHELFHDLNEIRVSTIRELEAAFTDVSAPEWRALRVRSVLQYIFEKNFAFDFETLRRKTLEAATEHIGKIEHLTPFVRAYSLHAILGVHLIPIDDKQCAAAAWLGLTHPDSTPVQCSDDLKPVVRKSDSSLFCEVLRHFATDPAVTRLLNAKKKRVPEGGYDLATAVDRLKAVFEKRKKQTTKKAAKKAAKPRAAAKKTAKKSSATTRKKATTKQKTTKKKTVRKKAK